MRCVVLYFHRWFLQIVKKCTNHISVQEMSLEMSYAKNILRLVLVHTVSPMQHIYQITSHVRFGCVEIITLFIALFTIVIDHDHVNYHILACNISSARPSVTAGHQVPLRLVSCPRTHSDSRRRRQRGDAARSVTDRVSHGSHATRELRHGHGRP